nr:hypothetical protein GCM10020063_102200 [Dactylosporangium thailandense]
MLAIALWPDPATEPPREREYLEFTACLLTPQDGVRGAAAGPVWAAMQDASQQTKAKVQYLEVSGAQTVENAVTFLNSLPEFQIEPSTTAHPNASDRTFTIAYDALARPPTQTLPGGVTITNTYNDVGKLTGETGAGAEGGANTFTYDDRGLLLTTSGVSGSATLGYKADGQLGSRLDAAGTTTYAYDSAGRLDTVANPGTSVATKLTYNTINQPKTVTYGGTGNVRTFGYNVQHRLETDELKTSGGTSATKITYGYDNNGNETSKATTGFGGTVTNTYTYDQANRLTS